MSKKNRLSQAELNDLNEGKTEFLKEKSTEELIDIANKLPNVDTQPKMEASFKPLIKTQYNAAAFPKYQETNYIPSATIPDQTMSLKELLERHTRGHALPNGKEPIYHGDDEDMPDLHRLDLAEIQELKESTAETIQRQQHELQTRYQEHQKQLFDKRKKEYESFLKSLNEDSTETEPAPAPNK